MKKQSIKILLILFSTLAYNILSAQSKIPVKNDSIKSKFDQKYISVSPLISPRICLGLVTTKQLNEKLLLESIYYIHGFVYSTYKVFGIGIRGNHFFRNKRRDGFYINTNAGFDYFEHEDWSYSIGGSNSDDNKEIVKSFFPNISVGFGYSIKVGNESFLRLNMDIGLKWFLGNIYLGFVW